MVQGTQAAHKLLELLIMKALVSGKARGSSIRLSSYDLAAELEQDAASDVDLVIKFDLSWDESVDVLDEILSEDIDDEQQ